LTESVYRRYAIVCESAKLEIMMNLPARATAGIVSGIDAHVRVQNSNSQLTAGLAEKP
jgi:hypothetical protein